MKKPWDPLLDRSPRLFYLKQAARTVRDFVTGSFPPEYQVYNAPLRKDLERLAPLCARSAEWFQAVLGPCQGELNWPLGRIYNGQLTSIDAELYYAALRHSRPSRVIEVGSGHSALFALDALKRNRKGSLLVIDPDPRRRLPRGLEHLVSRVEDVPLPVFGELRAGDVLFIDSSHTTEEARYHVEQLLPALAPGVLVHHHDICLPFDLPFQGDRDLYGEQEVVLDFYEAEQERFEVLCAAAWIRYEHPELLGELVPSYRWNPYRIPGSLWTRRL